MIAKHRSEELHAAVAHSPRRPERDRTIGVLEIARDRAGAKVYPASEVRVADESGVSLVGISQHHGITDFSSHFARRTDRTRSYRIAYDCRVRTNVAWSNDSTIRRNCCTTPNQNRPRRCVEHNEWLDGRARFAENTEGSKHGRVADWFCVERRRKLRNILSELIGELTDQIPRCFDPATFCSARTGTVRERRKRHQSVG